MPGTGEQFRISGELHLIVSPTHTLSTTHSIPTPFSNTPAFPILDWELRRMEVWRHLSSVRRASFSWPKSHTHLVPGAPGAGSPPGGTADSSDVPIVPAVATASGGSDNVSVPATPPAKLGAASYFVLHHHREDIVTHLDPAPNHSARRHIDRRASLEALEVGALSLDDDSDSKAAKNDGTDERASATPASRPSQHGYHVHFPSGPASGGEHRGTPIAKHHEVALGNFCLLLLDVDGADHLRLLSVPHQRTKYRRAAAEPWAAVTSSAPGGTFDPDSGHSSARSSLGEMPPGEDGEGAPAPAPAWKAAWRRSSSSSTGSAQQASPTGAAGAQPTCGGGLHWTIRHVDC
ncbi:hypothetical protein HK405_014159 [Cladochytrium tenue]|nr:hypothetical protein HK405_014159 [Cladochytrium tenue]